MNKLLHQVWIQGEALLPSAFKANRALWKAALPDWQMVLWDEETALSQWPEYAKVSHLCAHHAMRADLILARAQRDFGGIATGTDVIPNNIPNLLKWLDANETLVVANISAKSASNGLSYFKSPKHSFISCICRHQLRDMKLLPNRNVWAVTGPGCWYQVLARYMWNLALATDARAYTRLGPGKPVSNPNAWVDPGYAGSWWV